jgi:hypothetical protein
MPTMIRRALAPACLAFVLAAPAAQACDPKPAAPAPVAVDEPEWPVELPPVTEIVTDEQRVRQAIRSEVAAALEGGDIAMLERWSKQYRDHAERTPSGQWKLAFFYAGLTDSFKAIDAKDDAGWEGLDARLAKWQAQFPDSPSARLARAEAHIERAWAIRGGCYSASVDPTAWAPFRAHLAQARERLEADKAVAAADPHWYQLMARVALAQGWPQDQQAALEAELLEHASSYNDAVFAAASRYLPQWGGDAAALEAYAQRLLERTRAAEGDAMYARLYWSVMGSDDGLRLSDGVQPDWPTLRRSIDAVLAKYPEQWNRQHLAAMACNTQHYGDLPVLMRGIGDGAVLSAWGSKLNFATCLNMARRLGE